jgi:hypothetical protein
MRFTTDGSLEVGGGIGEKFHARGAPQLLLEGGALKATDGVFAKI